MSHLLLQGYSPQEYREMFALNDEDLAKKILACGLESASINADLHQLGWQVTSMDKLPQFKQFEFDLVLNSYDLFVRQADKPVEFHVQAITEMSRVGKEVRIFPLLNERGEISPLLGPVLLALQQANFGVEVREVPYHAYENGNAMLLVWAKECHLGE